MSSLPPDSRPSLLDRTQAAGRRLRNNLAFRAGEVLIGGTGLVETTATILPTDVTKSLETIPTTVPGFVRLASESGIPPQVTLAAIAGLSIYLIADGFHVTDRLARITNRRR